MNAAERAEETRRRRAFERAYQSLAPEDRAELDRVADAWVTSIGYPPGAIGRDLVAKRFRDEQLTKHRSEEIKIAEQALAAEGMSETGCVWSSPYYVTRPAEWTAFLKVRGLEARSERLKHKVEAQKPKPWTEITKDRPNGTNGTHATLDSGGW